MPCPRDLRRLLVMINPIHLHQLEPPKLLHYRMVTTSTRQKQLDLKVPEAPTLRLSVVAQLLPSLQEDCDLKKILSMWAESVRYVSQY